jgi:hypothetical protein
MHGRPLQTGGTFREQNTVFLTHSHEYQHHPPTHRKNNLKWVKYFSHFPKKKLKQQVILDNEPVPG